MASDLKESFSVDEVCAWLNCNGFKEVSQAFYDEGIDGEAMSCLTENALSALVKKIGPRMKLLKIIEGMESDNRSSSTEIQSRTSSSGESVPDFEDPVFIEPSSESTLAAVKRKWTSPFILPERFPPLVEEMLQKKGELTKQARCKFMQTIYDRICLFTISPTPDQRRDVCRAIIMKYPFLADAGGGFEIWYRYLGDKVKNELRNEMTDPLVMSRKRKFANGIKSSPQLKKIARRGIVNWAPPAIEGEDAASCQAHVVWMQKEKKKRQPNVTLVNKKMELTYSFRRKMLNEEQYLLKDILLKYPFLFDRKQLRCEYNRLMADDTAADCIPSNILSLAPKVIKVAEKKNLSSKSARSLLNLCKDVGDDEDESAELSAEDRAFVAICLLPCLLEKKSKTAEHESFLYQFGDPKDIILSSKSGMAPFLVFGGTLDEPQFDEVAVVAENQVLLHAHGLLESVELMMMVYYINGVTVKNAVRSLPVSLIRKSEKKILILVKKGKGGRRHETTTFTNDQLQEIYDAFSLYDKSNKNKIFVRDVPRVCRLLGINETALAFDDAINCARRLTGEPDSDKITLDTFLIVLKEIRKFTDVDKDARSAYMVFDPGQKGYFNIRLLRDSLLQCSQTITTLEMVEIFRAADPDLDGRVREKEFSSLLRPYIEMY